MKKKHININALISFLFGCNLIMPAYLNASVPDNAANNKTNNQHIQKPDWLVKLNEAHYDGDSDDLVTAGIGFTPLSRTALTPKFADSNHPTPLELRRAKLTRYINIKTGEGSLYGFDSKKLTPLFDGKIAGTEIQAVIKNQNVGLLLQIPIDFDKKNPCIVAIPATDSDGLYNAKDMQIRGLWGLKHNCAVVYNDKGLGNGIYDITHDRSYGINGEISADQPLFSPQLIDRDNFVKKYPNRYAIKQLHSKQNPEAKWGEYVLNSIEFAFYQLNLRFSPTQEVIFDKNNTLVLVYGASDGGGAALKAGEQDKDNIIDGIVAINPQILATLHQQPLKVSYNNKTQRTLESKSIADYSLYAALYIPCAVPAIVKKNSNQHIAYSDKYVFSQNRCDMLKNYRLLAEATPQAALQKLYDYGWSVNMLNQLPYFYYTESIALPYQYISSYGRYDVTDNMCNYSVASTDQNKLYNQGEIAPLNSINFAQLWSIAKGRVPVWLNANTATLNLVNNIDANSSRSELFSTSQNSNFIDYNTMGAICLMTKLDDVTVNESVAQIAATGNLNNIKTFIVHGKNNVKQLTNYTSQPYVALNSLVEGETSQLRYIEVDNASYLDSVIPFDNVLVPIDYYGESAMNWLWANLTNKAALPESQVIPAKARQGKSGNAEPMTADIIVPIMQSPLEKNVIKINNGTIMLPYDQP